MNAIIGFIDAGAALEAIRESLGEAPTPKRDFILPIGYRINGQIERHDWEACQLILFDDARYADEDHGIVRSSSARLALLVQHGSSNRFWEEQKSVLIRLGWRPRQIDAFNHGSGFPFWQDMQFLLTHDDPEARAKRLADMAARYKTAQDFRLLDVWAAYAVLAEVDESEASELSQRQLLDDLPDNWIRCIVNEKNTSLCSKLATADEILSGIVED